MTFQVGTKVARFASYSNEPRLDEVVKVYKNGNFILKSDPRQQWASHGGTHARETGSGYSNKARCQVWDESIDQSIVEAREKAETRKTMHQLTEKLASKKNGYGDWFLTSEQLTAARALLAALEVAS